MFPQEIFNFMLFHHLKQRQKISLHWRCEWNAYAMPLQHRPFRMEKSDNIELYTKLYTSIYISVSLVEQP